MKRILVVDEIKAPEIVKDCGPQTEIVTVDTLESAFGLLKVKYNFDSEKWDKEHPHAPTPVQRPHLERAFQRRKAEVATRLPYWDAFFVRFKSCCGIELCTAIGAASVALSCGCQYAVIAEVSSESFSWFPETDFFNRAFGFYVGKDRKKSFIVRHDKYEPLELRRLLMDMILENSGYDGLFANNLLDGRERLSKVSIDKSIELFENNWPGLFR